MDAPEDDAIGCDTTLNLGYVYNSEAKDMNFADIGLPPPAVGFYFFQGPMVPALSGDTAISQGKYYPGYKNLPMTSFPFIKKASTDYLEPMFGNISGTLMWYNLMRGLISDNGQPFPQAITGGGKFCFPGDPVTSNRPTFIGLPSVVVPQDARIALCSGPFTMAPGDTQEVVVALLGGFGADYLSSISVLKAEEKAIKESYTNAFSVPPLISSSVAISGSQATVSFMADARDIGASAVTINLKTYGDSLVAALPLADDGLHNDGGAGDKIYGNSVQLKQMQTGLTADAVVTYPDGKVLTWSRILNNITTTKLTVPSYSIVSDNINGDGVPNPGENVRYIFSLKNNSSLGFSNLTMHAYPALSDNTSALRHCAAMRHSHSPMIKIILQHTWQLMCR